MSHLLKQEYYTWCQAKKNPQTKQSSFDAYSTRLFFPLIDTAILGITIKKMEYEGMVFFPKRHGVLNIFKWSKKLAPWCFSVKGMPSIPGLWSTKFTRNRSLTWPWN